MAKPELHLSLQAALLLCFLICTHIRSVSAYAWEFLAPDKLPHPSIRVDNSSVKCDTTMDDLHDLFKVNLFEDLRFWRSVDLNMSAFDSAMKSWPDDIDTWRLALIYNNTFYFPRQAQPDPSIKCEDCNPYMRDAARAFGYWNKTMRFPNALFFFNVNDHPKNGPEYHHPGPVPILSLSKYDPDASPKDKWYRDLLVPKLPHHHKTTVYTFPWDKKENKAVWRGTRWGDLPMPQKHVNMSRWYVAELLEQDEEARQYIDFGYVAGDKGIPIVPAIHHPDMIRWKFLLSLDGFTAAYRLSKYMLSNSVVLKEESIKIEYYYRSLVPWKHYIPVFRDNKTDIIDIMRRYRQPDKQDELIHIASQARAFASKYCCPRARMLYWQRVLIEYRSLFADMDAAIEQRWWPMVKEKLDKARQSSVGRMSQSDAR